MKLRLNDSFISSWLKPKASTFSDWLQAFSEREDDSIMRQYIRHPSDIPIHFHLDEDAEPAPHQLIDISQGGLCFTAQQPVSQGVKIHIHIPIDFQISKLKGGSSKSDEFTGDGIVAWCRKEGERYAVGVQFDDSTTQFGVRMVEQVCHIERYRYNVLKEEGRRLSSEEAAQEWVERFAAEFPAAS